jgi:hypothetical protein
VSETSHTVLLAVHWLAGFTVLAEGLNKLHRTDPLAAGLTTRQRVVVWLKAFAWILLVLGAGGAVVRPVVVTAHQGGIAQLLIDRVSLVDVCVLAGFAVLILRSRLKEG